MTTVAAANFWQAFLNGHDVTADSQELTLDCGLQNRPALVANTGIKASRPGGFKPSTKYTGFISNGAEGVHNIVRSLTDQDYIFSAVLGPDRAPAVGDWGWIMKGLPTRHATSVTPGEDQRFDLSLVPRGQRAIRCKLLYLASSTANIAGTEVDMGAAAVGLAYGGLACCHVITPSAVKATGSLSYTGAIADGNHFDINGGTAQVYTFKTTLTVPAAPGEVKLGTTDYLSMVNLWYAMVGSPVGLAAGGYAAGTTPLQATIVPTPPTAAGVLALTARDTGTGPNAFTLAKTGVNLAVSGATLAGGTAGEAMTALKVQTATTSGGSFSDAFVFTVNGLTQTAEIIEVAPGVTINRYWKVVSTRAAETLAMKLAILGKAFHL